MMSMGDKHEHYTRLLPYLLDLLTDDNNEVREQALTTLLDAVAGEGGPAKLCVVITRNICSVCP